MINQSGFYHGIKLCAAACLKNNPLFPNLPIAYADLPTLATTFQNNLAAAIIGGPKDTAVF